MGQVTLGHPAASAERCTRNPQPGQGSLQRSLRGPFLFKTGQCCGRNQQPNAKLDAKQRAANNPTVVYSCASAFSRNSCNFCCLAADRWVELDPSPDATASRGSCTNIAFKLLAANAHTNTCEETLDECWLHNLHNCSSIEVEQLKQHDSDPIRSLRLCLYMTIEPHFTNSKCVQTPTLRSKSCSFGLY